MMVGETHSTLRRELAKDFAEWRTFADAPVDLAELDEQLKQSHPAHAMMNWMRLEHLRAFPSVALLEAGNAAKHSDANAYAVILASCASPLKVYALAPRGHDGATLPDLRLWTRCGSYAMRSLALMRAVRTVAYSCYRWSHKSGVGYWARQRLQALAIELGGTDEEKALLLWQVWGGLARFRMREGVSDIDEAIRDTCRTQIICANAARLPPEGDRWAEGNGSWESLLLYIASGLPRESRRELVDAFLTNVERRLRGESHARPNLNQTEGLWTTEAFVLALLEEDAASTVWTKLLEEVLERARPWPRGRRQFDDENLLAWLLLVGAAAAGSLAEHGDKSKRGEQLGRKVFAIADTHVGRGWHEAHSISGALPNLAWNLARAARCLTLEERERALLRIGDRLTSADAQTRFIAAVEGMVRAPVLRELRSARRSRRAFEKKLDVLETSEELDVRSATVARAEPGT